jgi:hypothetical protein
MVVHVDDFAIAASNDEIVEQLLNVLRVTLSLYDLSIYSNPLEPSSKFISSLVMMDQP